MMLVAVVLALGFFVYVYGRLIEQEPAFHWNTHEAQVDREFNRGLSFVRWQPWFAWRPVKLQDDSWVWLAWVERLRLAAHDGYSTKASGEWEWVSGAPEHWEYRLS